jgi:ketosteroid isomerase-like protein
VLGASELARLFIDRWNAGDLEAVYASWDPQIIVRPDPYYPDSGELRGAAAARRFWEDQREFSGAGRLEILGERGLGDRHLMRVRQHVDAPASGVHGAYEWSWIVTARQGRVVMVEFYIDRDAGLAAADLQEQP